MPIPWIKLIKHAPAALSLSREVLQAARQKKPSGSVDDKGRNLRKLQDDLLAQAEVIHALARQVEGLTAAANALRRGMILAISLGTISFLSAAAALAVALLKG